MVEKKFKEFGAEVTMKTLVGDDKDNIRQAILDMIAQGAEVVVCTGGMSVDPDDRTPGAIAATGAEVITYGAPVLPGAMMLLSYYHREGGEAVPVLGLPGCVMYAKRTILISCFRGYWLMIRYQKKRSQVWESADCVWGVRLVRSRTADLEKRSLNGRRRYGLPGILSGTAQENAKGRMVPVTTYLSGARRGKEIWDRSGKRMFFGRLSGSNDCGTVRGLAMCRRGVSAYFPGIGISPDRGR